MISQIKDNYSNESPLLIAELILDIFYDCIDSGIEEITQNQILICLGVPKNKIDKRNDIVYDLKELSSKDSNVTYETLLQMFSSNDNQ